MTFNVILWAVFISATFALWPILARRSGASGQWVSTVVVAAGLIPIALLSIRSMFAQPISSWKSLFMLLAAGLINGCAVYIYGLKVANKAVPTGIFMTTVSLMFLVWVPFLDLVINKQPMLSRQVYGVILAMTAVYLLRSN